MLCKYNKYNIKIPNKFKLTTFRILNLLILGIFLFFIQQDLVLFLADQFSEA